MKIYKRIISIFAVLALCFSLNSCATKTSTSSLIPKTETDRMAAEIAAKYKNRNLAKINDGKPVTIKVHLGDIMPTLSEVPTPEQPDVFNSTRILQKAFKILYPNVTIEWARTVDSSSADSFLQYISTQFSSKTAPDIVFAWGSAFASHNWFYDYTESLAKPNPYVEGNKQWKDQFPAYIFSTWNVSDAKDQVIAIPLSLSAGTATALYYNKQIFEKCGISPPKTWEDLFKVSKVVTDKGYISFSPWGGPGSGNRKVTTQLWDIQFSLGPFYLEKIKDRIDYNKDGMFSQNEKLRAAYEGYYFVGKNDYAKNLWKQVKRKYTDCLQPGYENADYESKWMLGKVGILEDGLWRYPTELSNTERTFDFGIIPAPAVDVDTTKLVNKLEYTSSGPYRPRPEKTFNILMPSIKSHGGQGTLDACVKFLQFLTEPENNSMIILEQKGKSISFQKGAAIPPELSAYFDQPFPKVPSFEWPGGFTNVGSEKESVVLELWVKNQLSDAEFYSKFDNEFKKDIEDYIKELGVDITGWKKGW